MTFVVEKYVRIEAGNSINVDDLSHGRVSRKVIDYNETVRLISFGNRRQERPQYLAYLLEKKLKIGLT